MKAGIITLHSVANYGTQLQLYATQEKMKEYFDNVEFIDYRRADTYGLGLFKTFVKGNPLKAIGIIPTLCAWKFVFDKFRKRYINLSNKIYYSEKDFEGFEENADVYFSGSDQVWNYGWNHGLEKPFYLSFVAQRPKYAYASSFGRESIDAGEVFETRELLLAFEKITVREQSAIDILRKQYGYENVSHILDPTLNMPKEFWKKVEPAPKIKEKYILIYNLNRSKEFDEYTKKLEKKTGYRLYRLCTRIDQALRCGKSILLPSIFEFVTLIDHAELVVTDSFHATAFAMNMNTEPICIYPKEYAGRIDEFLSLLDEKKRHIQDFNDFEVLDRHVNFDIVNVILEKERKKADAFLKEVAENVRKKEGNV